MSERACRPTQRNDAVTDTKSELSYSRVDLLVVGSMCKGDTPQQVKPKPLPTIHPYGANAVEVEGLTFSYDQSPFNDAAAAPILNNLDLKLPTGSRCLLLGANGAGKSTLLRILAGRHLCKPDGCVRILGLNAFRDTKLNFHRAYLDCDWGMRSVAFASAAIPLCADIPVHSFMEKLQQSYPQRRNELVEMLNINLDWRMNELSDGQRRRVQILVGLLRPFKVLLLDEITTSLDVCVRQDLLKWLVKESEERGATIIYATHIFDGLDDWATHLFYLSNRGNCGWQGAPSDLDLYRQLKEENFSGGMMLAIADHWLRRELEENRKKRRFEKAQGQLAHQLDPTDRQGGYSSGRNIRTETTDKPIVREGRLSDVLGNKGVLSKHT